MKRSGRFCQVAIPFAILVAAILGTAAVSPRLLEFRSLMNFLNDACPLLIMVIGGTLPILLGSIDVSVAGMACLASVLAVQLNPVSDRLRSRG
jgi:ribose transport system permease protein